MNADYLEEKILEALELSGGNQARARQHLIAWSMEDAQLLRILVRPHLTGIISYAVQRVAKRAARKKSDQASRKSSPPSDKTFGEEMLSALSDDNAEIFGQSSPFPTGRKPEASARHEKLMRMLAQDPSKTKKR